MVRFSFIYQIYKSGRKRKSPRYGSLQSRYDSRIFKEKFRIWSRFRDTGPRAPSRRFQPKKLHIGSSYGIRPRTLVLGTFKGKNCIQGLGCEVRANATSRGPFNLGLSLLLRARCVLLSLSRFLLLDTRYKDTACPRLRGDKKRRQNLSQYLALRATLPE